MSGQNEGRPDGSATTSEREGRGWMTPLAVVLLVAGLALIFVGVQDDDPAKMQGFPGATPTGPSIPGAPGSGGATAGAMPVSESFEESVARLEAILEEDPGDVEALKSMAELMLASHQAERALGFTDQWLEAAPGDADAMLQRMMAFAALERWDEAIDANRTLYEMEPTRRLTRLNMGSLYGNAGDSVEARRWWQELIADAPESNEAEAARRAIAQMDGRPPS